MMKRNEAIAILNAHRKELKEFQVKSLDLFGSVARDEAKQDSDIDLLVEFDRPVGLITFARLKRYLEGILGRSVDLGTPDSLKPYLIEPVMKDLTRAF